MKPQLFYPEFNFFLNIEENKYNYFKSKYTIQDDNHPHNLFENLYLHDGMIDTIDFYQPIKKIIHDEHYDYNYIDDYLEPIIKIAVNEYFNKIRLESFKHYGLEQKIYFLKEQKLKIIELIDDYEKATFFISTADLQVIKAGLLELNKNIFAFQEETDEFFFTKINFNIKQKHLLMLFKAFLDLNIISGININDLMVFLQEHTTYHGKKLPNPKDQLRKELSKANVKNYDINELNKLLREIINV